MAKYNIHAGHNPDGKVACGAVGLIKESTEARNVVKYMKEYMKKAGHTVYDCTCNNGKSQNDVLVKIVTKCNKHTVKYDVSIHFNSGAGDKKGNGKTTGVEVLVYSLTKDVETVAKRVCKNVSKLGFTNRGVKVRPDLYVLRNTKNTAFLVECCFVDDKDDTKKYNAKKMAKAIVEGILGEEIKDTTAIEKGDKVKIKSGAIYGGSSYKKEVPAKNIGVKYTVSKIQSNKHGLVVLREALLKEINSWVPIKYLTK